MALSSRSFKVSSPNRKIQDVPDATPVISAVSDGGAAGATAYDGVSVSISSTIVTGGIPDAYKVVATPGNITAVGGSPVQVRGLTPGTSYTFTATAQTSAGTLGTTSPASSSATPTGAYVQIATWTANGTTRDAAFTSIPQSYKDLYLVAYCRTTTSAVTELASFYSNNYNGAGHTQTSLEGNGSSATSSKSASGPIISVGTVSGASATANTFSLVEVNVLNYSSTNTFKPVLTKSAANSSGTGKVELRAGSINDYNPITQIVIFPLTAGASWSTGSTFTLYGVKGA